MNFSPLPRLAAFLLLMTAPWAAPAGERPAAVADVVFLGGKIWTVNKAQPEAEALAAGHGRILAVGRDADVRSLIGPGTRVVELKGRRVVPGFYDSHVHLLGSGL